MDAFIDKLLHSTNSPEYKLNILNKIIRPAKFSPETFLTTVRNVLKWFTSKDDTTYLFARTITPRLMELDVYSFAAEITKETFGQLFVDPTFDCYKALEAAYMLLNVRKHAGAPMQEDYNVLKAVLSLVLRDHNSKQNELFAAIFVVLDHPGAMPSVEVFIQGACRFLSNIDLSQPEPVPVSLPVATVCGAIDQLCHLLRGLCEDTSARNTLLREIMMILLGRETNPFLLSMVIPAVDEEAVSQLETYMDTSFNQFFKILLNVLAWPQSRTVIGWSLLLVTKLRSRLTSEADPQQHYADWLAVADAMTPLLSFELFFPSLREGALQLLENLLIGVHMHSPKNFHTCLRPIVEVFRLLHAQLQRLRESDDTKPLPTETATASSQLPPFTENIFILNTSTTIEFHNLSQMYQKILDGDRINGASTVTLPHQIFDQTVALPIKDTDEHSQYEDMLTTTLDRIATLLHVKMFQHKGHPELYAPVLKALGSQYPSPSDLVIADMIRKMSFLGQTSLDFTSMEYQSESDFIQFETRSDAMKTAQLCGLSNLGNTCFANSFLQALFATDKLTDALISQPPSPSSALLANLQKLFAAMILTERYAFSPSDFLHALPDWLRGGQQHDSSEFGRYLLDHVEEAIKKDFNGKPPTSISSLFGGKTVTLTTCSVCGHRSQREEDFVDLGLMFPPQESREQPIHLIDLLNFYVAPEKMTGDNQYRCSKCDQLRDADKFVAVTQAPQHLIITLNRFSYDLESQSRKKISQEVEYPDWIDVPVHENGNVVSVPYALYAVVMHSGQSAEYGHYYSYARHSDPTSSLQTELAPWYRFNDENVAPSSLEAFTSITKQFPNDVAYMLFYVRVQDTAAPRPRSESTIAPALVSYARADNDRFSTSRANRSSGKTTTKSTRGYVPMVVDYPGGDDDMDFDGPPPPMGGGLGMAFGGGPGIS